MQSQHCLNCGETILGAGAFCSACGQKTVLTRLRMSDVVHDGLHYFTHADKGILQLVKGLIVRNGIIAREYVSGKRKRYFPPLNFFLVVAGIFLFMTTVFHRYEQIDSAGTARATLQLEQLSDSGQKKAQIALQRKSEALRFINKYSNFVAMVAAPLITFVVWLFYRRAGYNYTEHLTANLYLTGMTNLFYALIIVPVAYLLHVSLGNFGVIIFFALVEIIYRSIFYYRFLNKNAKLAAVKSAAVAVVAIVSWSLFIFTCLGIYIMIGYMK